MISSVIKLSVSPERRAEVLTLLRPLVAPTRYMTGCRDCGLYENAIDGQSICLATEWANQDGMTEFIRSDEFQRVLAAMDLCNAPPDVQISEACETHGVDYIAILRDEGSMGEV